MKIILCVAATVFLSGCTTTVPVMIKFPSAPAILMEPAERLQPLNKGNVQLSDIIENANENAAKYYILRDKYNAWQEWYTKNQKIYEEVQKKYSK